MFSALAEQHGNLRAKLDIFMAFAPIVELKHSTNSMLQNVSKQWRQLEVAGKTFNAYELKNPAFDTLLRLFCNAFGAVCDGISSFFSDATPWNSKERSVVESHRPASSASLKQLVHYGQNIQEGVFRQFDYGSDDANIQVYGTNIPPVLDIADIEWVHIAMFVGAQDDLADITDTRSVKEKIHCLAFYNEYQNMDHYSFSIGLDQTYMEDVFDLLDKYAEPEPGNEFILNPLY